MKLKITPRLIAQSVAVLVCAFTIKQFYSTASVDQLKWILAPTTRCVELLSGESFEFESHSGYVSADHSFLIAASCAGVNFLLTAFLMLAARRLLPDWRSRVGWMFIPGSLLTAYFATLIANTIRILIAMKLQKMDLRIGLLDSGQLHRLEGIVVYFTFLSLLFVVNDRLSRENNNDLKRRWLLPLVVYYATMVGIPLLNGAYRRTNNFWEYTIVVVMVPLLLTAIVTVFKPVFATASKRCLRFCDSVESVFNAWRLRQRRELVVASERASPRARASGRKHVA